VFANSSDPFSVIHNFHAVKTPTRPLLAAIAVKTQLPPDQK
jgi:hypothetical protein